MVLTGELALDATTPAPADNPTYLAKYGGQIEAGPWGTPETFAETFGTPLRFTPQRVRGH